MGFRRYVNDGCPEPVVGHIYRAKMPRPAAYNEGPVVNDRIVTRIEETGIVFRGQRNAWIYYDGPSSDPKKCMDLRRWMNWVKYDITDGWTGWVPWNAYLGLPVREVPPKMAPTALVLLLDARELLLASRISTGPSADLTRDSAYAKLDQAIDLLQKSKKEYA